MFKKKKEIEKRDIDAEDLIKIISHNANDKLVLKERLNKLSFSEDSICGLDSHIRHIKAEAKACGLAEYIFVEKFKEPTFVKEAGFEIPYQYKVTVSNLNINLSTVNAPKIFMHDLYVLDAVSGGYKSSDCEPYGMLYFEFKGNTISNTVTDFCNCIDVYLGQSATLSFIGNHFKMVGIVVKVDNAGASTPTARKKVAVLEFKNNISESPISIGKYSSKEKNSIVFDSWRLKRRIRGKIYAANEIEGIINESDFAGNNKIKVTPEQIEKIGDKCIIRMSDNKFDALSVFGMTNFYFEGKNIIKQLTPYVTNDPEVVPGKIPIEASIHWGAGQNLDEDGKYFFRHKKIFTVLKQRAIANGDIAQEIILQREIAKCNYALAKSEKWRAWQDIIIFGFSKWVSNYGASWVRPLVLLAILNLAVAWLAQLVCPCTDSDFLAISFALFNPTSSLPEMVGLDNVADNAWISFLFISQKVILAFALYEMVKIFRRFGRR